MKYIAFLVGALFIPSLSLVHGAVGFIDVAPDTLDYEAGTEVPLEVRIRTLESITSLRIHLRYDPATLEVRQVKPNTETFPYWWTQEAVHGTITLEASLPKPGFKGEDLVAAVVVAAKEAGTKLLEVDEDASLLLNAQDENILKPREENSPQNDYKIANTQSGGFVVVFGGLLVIGVVLGGVLFLRGRKK